MPLLRRGSNWIDHRWDTQRHYSHYQYSSCFSSSPPSPAADDTHMVTHLQTVRQGEREGVRSVCPLLTAFTGPLVSFRFCTHHCSSCVSVSSTRVPPSPSSDRTVDYAISLFPTAMYAHTFVDGVRVAVPASRLTMSLIVPCPRAQTGRWSAFFSLTLSLLLFCPSPQY